MLKRLLAMACLLLMCAVANAQNLTCFTCEDGAMTEGETCGTAVNDDCGSPTVAMCGMTMCGTLYTDVSNGTTDVDWYVFDLAADAQVTVRYNSKANAMVSLYTACGELPVAFAMNNSCVGDSLTGNLLAGVYYLQIMPLNDTLSCASEAYYNFQIECGAPQPCDLDVVIDATPSCPGSGTGGSLFAIAINGVAPYFYIWDNGSTDDFQTGLPDGTYAVSVVDANGCVDTASATLASVCPTPDGATVLSVNFNKATIGWIQNDCGTKYRVQVRQQGTTAWTTYISLTNERVVKNLLPGTTYQYRVRTQCSADGSVISGWTPIQTFTTLGTCTAPTGIGATPSSTSAFLSWTAGTGVYKYRLRYREQGSSTWTSAVIGGALTSKTINGLTANTTYEYQMRSQCNAQATDFSPYTPIQTFTTAMRLGETENTAIGLYPNPNTGAFTLTFNSDENETVKVSVYDLLGRSLSTQTIEAHAGMNALPMNLKLASGQYFVKLEGNTKANVARFNVQ